MNKETNTDFMKIGHYSDSLSDYLDHLQLNLSINSDSEESRLDLESLLNKELMIDS